MADSILTEYEGYCIFCGRPTNEEHHLNFGIAIRRLAEEDGLKVNACRDCHTCGPLRNRIHDNPMAEKLSKMLGQMAYEKHQVAKGCTEKEAREKFRKRYGLSYF